MCIFTYISQGSVETLLRYGGIYNNHIIANCPECASAKKFDNRSIIGKDINKSKVARFYWPNL